MRIHVQAKHIRKANLLAKGRRDVAVFMVTSQCPVALALRDHGLPQAQVFCGSWNRGPGKPMQALSKRTRELIHRWDCKSKMKPFAFNIQNP